MCEHIAPWQSRSWPAAFRISQLEDSCMKSPMAVRSGLDPCLLQGRGLSFKQCMPSKIQRAPSVFRVVGVCVHPCMLPHICITHVSPMHFHIYASPHMYAFPRAQHSCAKGCREEEWFSRGSTKDNGTAFSYLKISYVDLDSNGGNYKTIFSIEYVFGRRPGVQTLQKLQRSLKA